MSQPTLHAVIIGINAYKSRPLSGCVNDALAVGTYFEKLCAAPENKEKGLKWNPVYLLAPEGNDVAAQGLDFMAPTRANIIGVMEALAGKETPRNPQLKNKFQLKDGDFCLLYYSGHGSEMPAPKEFEKIEPSGMFQTLVAIDSREEGKHDLIDKELAYLIAEILKDKAPYENEKGEKKGVHFLALMDCCFAGSNTRGDDGITARLESAGRPAKVEDILGFEPKGNAFYKAFEPGQSLNYEHLQHARYVNLAAARDSELSQEKLMDVGKDKDGKILTKKHGVFTISLLSILEQNGVRVSYRELIRRVEMEVRSRVDKQIPLLEMTETGDDNLMFFRNSFVTPRQEYEVGFRKVDGREEWYMNAGAIQGITPSTERQKTIVELNSGTVSDCEVTEVFSSESILNIVESHQLDKSDLTIRAKIKEMAFPKIKIGFAAELPEEDKIKIRSSWDAKELKYLQLEEGGSICDYYIRLIKNSDQSLSYLLIRPGSDFPLFERADHVASFLGDVNKVGKWESVSRLSNPKTGIDRNNISVEVKIMEGVDIMTMLKAPEDEWKPVQFISKKADREDGKDEISSINPAEISVRYINGKMPAIKVKITNTNDLEDYHVGALYLDSHFGIMDKFLKPTKIGFEAGKKSVEMSDNLRGVTYQMVPVFVPDEYEGMGVVEINDYLLIVVSHKEFSLEHYAQESIEPKRTRAGGFKLDMLNDNKKQDWFTIKIPIHIYRPQIEQKINNGGNIQFPGFKVTFPGGFSAVGQATNIASAKRRVEALKKSKSAGDTKALLPPAHLWSETVGSEAVFAKTLATTPDNHINILELTRNPTLEKGQSILIKPNDALLDDEAIVPFGYDPVSGLYFPTGFTDENGNIVITKLPPQTDGVIGPDGVDEVLDTDGKSLPGSIKLFFQKVIWGKLSGKHEYNKLSLVESNQDGTFNHTIFSGKNQDAADKIKAATANGEVLLLIHGIIGDTEDQVKAVFQKTSLYKKYKAVLAFDYENLDTSIEKTAEELLAWLNQCEIPEKSITIVAHSMGGLVSRYMIENLGGDKLVSRLVQLGTPNFGSEIGDFRKKLGGWLTLGLNGVPDFSPYMTIASFIWKGIGKRMFNTLNQMQPESDFIKNALNPSGKTSPNVPYYLIIGDTTNIEAVYDKDDPAWRKLWACITDRGHYIVIDYAIFNNDPNDMAVRVESMKKLPWGAHVAAEKVDCDHVSYFRKEKSLVELEKMLEERV